MYRKANAFTIVELLIVIVVIGILASITLVAYNGIQERARVTSANSDLALLNKAIYIARINTDKTLMAVTGSNCTNCYDQARYELTINNLSTASSMNLSSLKKGDPWGAKYAIDENEGEGASPCVTKDGLSLNTSGKTGVNTQTISFYTCPN